MAVVVTKAILMCRDLLKNSNREQQQQLYPELTQALAAAQSSTKALPYLEVKAAFGHCTSVHTASSTVQRSQLKKKSDANQQQAPACRDVLSTFCICRLALCGVHCCVLETRFLHNVDKCKGMLLQALLVALETPRSPRGLHLLARHSQDLVSALLLFIAAATDASSLLTSPMTSANSSCHTPQQPVTHCSGDQGRVGDHQNGLQSAAAAAAAASLQSNVSAMNALQQLLLGHAQDKAFTAPMETLISEPSSTSWSAQGISSRALQGQLSSEESLYSAAAVATAHRCLESVLARESVFTLPPNQVAQALFSPAVVFTAALAGSSGRAVWGLTEGAGVFVGCCSLVMAGLRHHAGAVRRCMALVGASTRALLKMLMHWSQAILRSEHALITSLKPYILNPEPYIMACLLMGLPVSMTSVGLSVEHMALGTSVVVLSASCKPPSM